MLAIKNRRVGDIKPLYQFVPIVDIIVVPLAIVDAVRCRIDPGPARPNVGSRGSN